MKHINFFLTLFLSQFLIAGGVSFVQYLENEATFYPFDGTEPEALKTGYPLYPGDKITTERGTFLEAVLSDGNLLWVGSFSDLELRAISGTEGYPDKRTYIFLESGEVAYEAIKTPSFEEEPVIGFPTGDLYILASGVYYVISERRGNVRILIIEGKGEIATDSGSVYLRSGEEAIVYYDGYVDRKRLSLKNEFFVEKVESRRTLRYKSQSSQYTGRHFYTSNYIFDTYGSWIYYPEFSLYVWRPTVVVGWIPYYSGYWRWTPHGWFWVSYEPWGYITYHYGRWVWTPQYGWVWVPGYTWAPAWVYWVWFDVYFGWCPIGYFDYWWYYRWDWWWNWPPCWYNDCYHCLKGRINLSHLHKDFWIFAETKDFGKANLQIRKGFPADFKGKEGLVFSLNLPLEPKEIPKASEHFIKQKSIFKDDLTPVFKLQEKPSLEAKNILSSTKETISKGNNFLKIDKIKTNREIVFDDLKPSKRINKNKEIEIGKNKEVWQPRKLEKKVEEREFSNIDKNQKSSGFEREKILRERKSLKTDEPRKDTNPPFKIDREDREIKRKDSSNYNKREPINTPETKSYYKKIQKEYTQKPLERSYSYGSRESIKPSYERNSSSRSYTTPTYRSIQNQIPSHNTTTKSSPSPSYSPSSFSHSSPSHSSSSSSISSHSSPSSSHSSSSSSSSSSISRTR